MFVIHLFTCYVFSQVLVTSVLMQLTDDQVNSYLQQYGYMPKNNKDCRLASSTDRSAAIMEFQRMAGITQTGEIDNKTMEYMGKKRCGVPDNMGYRKDLLSLTGQTNRRRKRYVLQGRKWSSTRLSYRYLNYSSDLSRDNIRNEISRAFQHWSSSSRLIFNETNSVPDIEILFTRMDHGDGNSFDGRGRVLAHAFFPNFDLIGGDTHFDDDETFTLDGAQINLHQVATHEFGHALGLGHSSVSGAVMYPFYEYRQNFALHPDDVAGIQELYGANEQASPSPAPTTRSTTTTPTSTTSTSTSRSSPDYCTNSKVDAALLFNGNVFVFQGNYYLKLTNTGLALGYPKLIESQEGEFRGIPNNIDAAVTLPAVYQWTYSNFRFYFSEVKKSETFIFKGSRCWKFNSSRELQIGYPQDISKAFPGIPDDIDAAFVWSGNQQLYFIKGQQYYRFIRDSRVSTGYPRPLKNWRNLPNSIDAALQYINYRTYFFSGLQYYRFNDYFGQVDASYPKSISRYWFGCSLLGDLSDGMEEEMKDSDQIMSVDTQEMKNNSDTNNKDYPAIAEYNSYACDNEATSVTKRTSVLLVFFIAVTLLMII